MNASFLLCLIVMTAAPMLAANPVAPTATLHRVAALADQGLFAQAEALLAAALSDASLTDPERARLAFEHERLIRIRKDYRLTRAALWDALRQSVRDLAEEEFERWLAQGWFDGRTIDGVHRFIGPSVSNLFFRHPELEARRVNPPRTDALPAAYLADARAIRAAARAQAHPYVLPRRLAVTMTIAVHEGAATAGERIRAWIPIPREYPYQTDFEWVTSEPAGAQLGHRSSPIRSAYLEQPAAQAAPTRFRIQYAYTAYGVWIEVDPVRVRAGDAGDAALQPYLTEAPHVQFAEPMRRLARELGAGEANPARLAKRYYDWIADHIQYSYAREYSTVPDLGAYCLQQRYGDCGQAAFLFITLCRLSGIPARWQSGWSLFPGAQTIHDWCEIFLAPYGWVPVDPYQGIFARQYGGNLTAAERIELRDFYFGGLSAYRLAANADHNQLLSPAKTSLRSDPVDFQRGELEVNGRNVYFDQFTYQLEWRELGF